MKVYSYTPRRVCATCEQAAWGWVDMSPRWPEVNDSFTLPCGHSLLGSRVLDDVDLALAILMMDSQ